MEIERLSDTEISERLHAAVSRERELLVEVLALLGEFDRRRSYEKELSSCFDYCTKRLGYSEGAAFKRIQAARAVRLYRPILDHLACGELSLAAVVALKPHLTKANAKDIIGRARGLSKREIEIMAAALSTKPSFRRKDIAQAVVVQPVPRLAEAKSTPEPSLFLDGGPVVEDVGPQEAQRPAQTQVSREPVRRGAGAGNEGFPGAARS